MMPRLQNGDDVAEAGGLAHSLPFCIVDAAKYEHLLAKAPSMRMVTEFLSKKSDYIPGFRFSVYARLRFRFSNDLIVIAQVGLTD